MDYKNYSVPILAEKFLITACVRQHVDDLVGKSSKREINTMNDRNVVVYVTKNLLNGVKKHFLNNLLQFKYFDFSSLNFY